MTTPPTAMPLARNVVYRVGRRYMSSWFPTAPVLDAAGELLDAWCITADSSVSTWLAPLRPVSGPNASPSSHWR
ncbi:hypothetical protein GCM10011609_87070 [Lentzea pudingi]|uniref:Uncharacterized protein n=1 Tax=Lentzea pudingi TaxID=1789439 RepID=A0ABQ2IX05_9PSEU|nr:hypothetical protein [Lentzea pudingi]GGN29800.1 hypothetical protein GCM10011609_87070 [Lentzea pudingi]